jgi:hypothetical protein
MNWQDDERQWFEICDAYGEIIEPSEHEISKMYPVASKWYRTDGNISYCKITNTFVRFFANKIIYYRVTKESIERKKELQKQQMKIYLEKKLADVIQMKEKIEQKLKDL